MIKNLQEDFDECYVTFDMYGPQQDIECLTLHMDILYELCYDKSPSERTMQSNELMIPIRHIFKTLIGESIYAGFVTQYAVQPDGAMRWWVVCESSAVQALKDALLESFDTLDQVLITYNE